MKRLSLIGLSLLMLLALVAVAASSASAVEGFLPLKKVAFTVLGKTTTIESEHKGNPVITCAELKGTGKFESASHGSLTLDLLHCEILGFPAFSLGEAVPHEVKEALILIPALFLVCLISSIILQFGIFVELKESVHVDELALGSLQVIQGAVIGEVAPSKAKLFKALFKGKEGKQEIAPKCQDEKGGEKVTSLKVSVNGGVFEPGSLILEGGLLELEEEMELMDK